MGKILNIVGGSEAVQGKSFPSYSGGLFGKERRQKWIVFLELNREASSEGLGRMTQRETQSGIDTRCQVVVPVPWWYVPPMFLGNRNKR